MILGGLLYVSWQHAERAGLLSEEVTLPIQCAVERRIVAGQVLYLIGAALCFVDVYWSIAFIVLVQINFALAPRIPFLSRILVR